MGQYAFLKDIATVIMNVVIKQKSLDAAVQEVYVTLHNYVATKNFGNSNFVFFFQVMARFQKNNMTSFHVELVIFNVKKVEMS